MGKHLAEKKPMYWFFFLSLTLLLTIVESLSLFIGDFFVFDCFYSEDPFHNVSWLLLFLSFVRFIYLVGLFAEVDADKALIFFILHFISLAICVYFDSIYFPYIAFSFIGPLLFFTANRIEKRVMN